MAETPDRPPVEKQGKVEKPVPEWVTERLERFKQLEDRSPKVEPVPIHITLPGGAVVDGVAGVTKPDDVFKAHLADQHPFAASVDGHPWDLSRPLVASCSLGPIDFTSPEGKSIFWHSSAHILGQAIELELEGQLAIGPPTDMGFFYDAGVSESVDAKRLRVIEARCVSLSRQADYERKSVTREEALELFKANPYKVAILTKRVEPGELVSLYRTGSFIDLCRGPHISNGRVVKEWQLSDASGAVFEGDATKKVTRIRGITFPTKDLMAQHKKFLEEAARRDHRALGVKHELFFFHPWSPGGAFFYPDGAHVYHKLTEMIREQYRKRGFIEVITPNLFSEQLFRTSGHWDHYRDDMFHFAGDEEVSEGDGCLCRREIALKPMNCPGHCLVFRSRERSYRDLPLRMAEFGVLHRNEATGALSGLTRVRRFVQDDCHIFARSDQIGEEMALAIDFVKEVYGFFGMQLKFTLSTINMEKYMGDLAVWEEATNHLRNALRSAGCEFVEAPGEAAFYGPKIDTLARDSLGRFFQLATIQLDFQLPLKFDLKYIDSACQAQRPVMIHRAVLGSLERFIGVAVEHFEARFPFWLSPHQIVLTPLKPRGEEHEAQLARCQELRKLFHGEGFQVEIDDSTDTLEKRIHRARDDLLAHAIIVIGNNELKNGTVSVRWPHTPAKGKIDEQSLESFLVQIREMVAKKLRD